MAPCHCAKLYPLRGARGHRRAYRRGGGGGTVQAGAGVEHPVPNTEIRGGKYDVV